MAKKRKSSKKGSNKKQAAAPISQEASELGLAASQSDSSVQTSASAASSADKTTTTTSGELTSQVRTLDALLANQQVDLGGDSSSNATREEDDDLESELLQLARSEELLRQELEMLQGGKFFPDSEDDEEEPDILEGMQPGLQAYVQIPPVSARPPPPSPLRTPALSRKNPPPPQDPSPVDADISPTPWTGVFTRPQPSVDADISPTPWTGVFTHPQPSSPVTANRPLSPPRTLDSIADSPDPFFMAAPTVLRVKPEPEPLTTLPLTTESAATAANAPASQLPPKAAPTRQAAAVVAAAAVARPTAQTSAGIVTDESIVPPPSIGRKEIIGDLRLPPSPSPSPPPNKVYLVRTTSPGDLNLRKRTTATAIPPPVSVCISTTSPPNQQQQTSSVASTGSPGAPRSVSSLATGAWSATARPMEDRVAPEVAPGPNTAGTELNTMLPLAHSGERVRTTSIGDGQPFRVQQQGILGEIAGYYQIATPPTQQNSFDNVGSPFPGTVETRHLGIHPGADDYVDTIPTDFSHVSSAWSYSLDSGNAVGTEDLLANGIRGASPQDVGDVGRSSKGGAAVLLAPSGDATMKQNISVVSPLSQPDEASAELAVADTGQSSGAGFAGNIGADMLGRDLRDFEGFNKGKRPGMLLLLCLALVVLLVVVVPPAVVVPRNKSSDFIVEPGTGALPSVPSLAPTSSAAPSFSRVAMPTLQPTVRTPTTTQMPVFESTSAPTETRGHVPLVPTATPTITRILPTFPTQVQPPTNLPIFIPPLSPSPVPTQSPTRSPTDQPAQTPSFSPTSAPTTTPSTSPVVAPTRVPTTAPSALPVVAPTRAPSVQLTRLPTFPAEQALFAFLESIALDGGESLRDPNSPQFAAYEWLAGNANLDSYSEERLIQRYSLATLFYSAGGASWSENGLWLSDEDECDWYSRAPNPCGPGDSFRRLELFFNNAEGTIPPEIALLSNRLVSIDISGGPLRVLTGGLPSEYGLLTRLGELRLSNNNLVGNIPSQYGGLVSLKQIALSNNNLSGTLSPEIGEWTSLTSLNLAGNRLEGSLPSEISRWSKVSRLTLEDNFFSGGIATEIGLLANLRVLSLSNNRLTDFPSDVGLLTRLVFL